MIKLMQLCKMEKSLKTEETRKYAYPTYKGEVSATIDGLVITIKATGNAHDMTYFVNNKKVSFKKLCAILEIK